MGARGDGAAGGMRGSRLAAWAPPGWVLPVPRWGGTGWERSPRVLAASSQPRSVFRLAVWGRKHRLRLKAAAGWTLLPGPCALPPPQTAPREENSFPLAKVELRLFYLLVEARAGSAGAWHAGTGVHGVCEPVLQAQLPEPVPWGGWPGTAGSSSGKTHFRSRLLVPVMNKQGLTMGKCVMGMGGVFRHLSSREGVSVLVAVPRVSCPVLAPAQGGCWQHPEPGLLPVRSHIGTCQGHICRASHVPPSVNGDGGFCLAGGSRQQWDLGASSPVSCPGARGVHVEVQGDAWCSIPLVPSLAHGKTLLFSCLVPGPSKAEVSQWLRWAAAAIQEGWRWERCAQVAKKRCLPLARVESRELPWGWGVLLRAGRCGMEEHNLLLPCDGWLLQSIHSQSPQRLFSRAFCLI